MLQRCSWYVIALVIDVFLLELVNLTLTSRDSSVRTIYGNVVLLGEVRRGAKKRRAGRFETSEWRSEGARKLDYVNFSRKTDVIADVTDVTKHD